MKNLAILIVFTLASFASFAQLYAVEISQTTERYIRQLPENEQVKFDSVLALRKSADWLRRIDSISYDYAFIEEVYSYCDTSGSVEERYFSQDDSIPKLLVYDGESIVRNEHFQAYFEWSEPKHYYRLTLPSMLAEYSAFKHTQERTYARKQHYYTGCVVRSDAEEQFRKSRTAYLATSYRIMTLIDKVNNRVIVSVQTAPKKPRFRVVRVGSGF